jgi:hypothetical protein
VRAQDVEGCKKGSDKGRKMRRGKIFEGVEAEHGGLRMVNVEGMLVSPEFFQESSGAVTRVGEGKKVDKVAAWGGCFRNLYV